MNSSQLEISRSEDDCFTPTPITNLSFFASRTPSATFSKSQNSAMLWVSFWAAIARCVKVGALAARLAADHLDLDAAIGRIADDLFHARQCIAVACLGHRLSTALA